LIELVKGTIEHIPVNVRDRLGNLTDLGGTAPTYLVRKESDESVVIAETAADLTIPAGMTAYCLIDTTTLDKDRYELLLRFNLLPEVPLLGPFDFEIV
jgi:hypothetical protein